MERYDINDIFLKMEEDMIAKKRGKQIVKPADPLDDRGEDYEDMDPDR